MTKPNVVTPSQAQTEFDSVRWALLNPWLLEGQADDRTPMNGSVKDSGETPWETYGQPFEKFGPILKALRETP